MGFGSKSDRSSNPQQSSRTGKEKAHLPHADLRLKSQSKLNVKNDSITFPFGILPGEIVNNQIQSTLVETKPLGDCKGQSLKSRPTKEDELVRYMSNLPGYLQRVDSSDNLQEKALNVGVLDWELLEKWKHHRKHTPKNGNDESSTITISSSKTNAKSSTFSNVVPKVASANKGMQQHSSTCLSLTPSQKDDIPRGAKPYIPKLRHYRDIETPSKSTLDRKKTSKTYKSFHKINSDANLEKGKRKELDQKITSDMGNIPSNMKNHGVSPLPKKTASVCDSEAKNRVEQTRDTNVNKKDLDNKSTSDMEASSSKTRNHAVSLGSSKMLGAESNKTKKKDTEKSEHDLNHECSPGEHKNIVLLPSSARNNFFEEPLKGTLNEAKCNSSSYDMLQKDHFRELYSDVPHSCTFPSGVEMNPETDMMEQGLESLSDASTGSLFSDDTGNVRFQGKYSAESKTKSQDADFETLKILEEEMAELANERSRTTSPNRRFSFSLSRISRSFSFKESSAVPQLSSNYVSVRSGPVRYDSSGFLDDANIEKLNGRNRTRSSPLRRVLDPLLKSKGLNSFRSTDTVQPPKGSLNSSTPRPLDANESFQEEKLGSSMIKALLEVAMKNGHPLLKFVVTNGSNMLATTMKSLASSGKVGSNENYVFSSVSEVKKKSGSWISKGNKEKNCGYIYNIIGQMKISNSHVSDLTAEDSCNYHLVRESVLFSVEQGQGDQALAKFTPSTELAAVVIKIPAESNEQKADKDIVKTGSTESLATDGCPCFRSATVILPSGVHSMPNKGMPSPLIDRWRFGGLCDCGGWDVGCKLHILSNQNSRCCKNSREPQTCQDHLELFPQGAQQNMPIFSLVPHTKGIYAIKFSSSITALQAFFISVTVITCWKSSDLPEFSNLPEGKVMKETMLDGRLGMDSKPTIVLGTMPAKYAPNPPHSPVGRV
ncbi:hypothetical protein V6N13_027594 [Hibiscus sabdariffa]|uniref:Uncharacterized protein n=1 Tax=Hibiscus sabdariffa TaxID=183260 RepID=A0ABR2CF02_9ROSI